MKKGDSALKKFAKEVSEKSAKRFVAVTKILHAINDLPKPEREELYRICADKHFTKPVVDTSISCEELEGIKAKWLDRIMQHYDGSEIVLETELHEFAKELLQSSKRESQVKGQPSPNVDELVEKIDMQISELKDMKAKHDLPRVKKTINWNQWIDTLTEIRTLLQSYQGTEEELKFLDTYEKEITETSLKYPDLKKLYEPDIAILKSIRLKLSKPIGGGE